MRSAPRAASRAAPVACAGPRHHHAMAAGIFVPAGLRPGIVPPHSAGPFSNRLGADQMQRRFGNADIGQHHFAAQIAPRQQQMRRFLAEEGDGESGASRDIAQRLAAVAVNAAGHVDGDHGTWSRSAPSTSRASRLPAAATGRRRTAHPRPGRAIQRPGGKGLALAVPFVRHRRGIAFVARAPPATRTAKPRSASSRATTKPSPPLLPGPHSTATAQGAKRAAMASATARPAFSIRVKRRHAMRHGGETHPPRAIWAIGEDFAAHAQQIPSLSRASASSITARCLQKAKRT